MPLDDRKSGNYAAIALRRSMRRQRRSAWLCLLLGTILAALVWSHSGGEAMVMADEHPAEIAMAVCLAILNATLLVAVGIGLGSLRRRFELSSPSACQTGPRPGVMRPLQRPPPRAGPSQLQVFLR